MDLTESQKKYLRGLGHQLKAIVTVGDAGLSDSVMKELDLSMSHHELIKVRIRATNRESRDALIGELCKEACGSLIQRVGNVALIYRRNPDEPKIKLP